MYQRKLKKIPDLTGVAFRTTTYKACTCAFWAFQYQNTSSTFLKLGLPKTRTSLFACTSQTIRSLSFFVLSKDGQLYCIYKTNVPTSHYRHVYFQVNWTWLICVPAVHGARDKISGNYLFIYFPTTNLNCFCSLIITISFQKGLKKRNFPHTYHSTYYLIWAGFIRNNELSFDTWISRGTWRAP